jgi:hypothetical protein
VRETLVTESQSSWSVPIPKEQKKVEQKKEKTALETQLKKFESAIDQAKKNLDTMDFTREHRSLTRSITEFVKWDKNIDNYSAMLQKLKSVDKELYEEKTEKIKKIKELFVTKLYERVVFVSELIREAIKPLRQTLKANNAKKPGLMSFNAQEFQTLSYQVFFGPLDKELWKKPATRKNILWFQGDVPKVFEMYWNQELVQSSDLLFKYHNIQKIMTNDQSDALKTKIGALRDEISAYKKLLSEAYNAMMTVLNKFLVDDQKDQRKLLEKDYGNHLKLLDSAYNTLKKDFLDKLWPQ